VKINHALCLRKRVASGARAGLCLYSNQGKKGETKKVSHTTDFLDEIAHRNGIRPTSYAIAKHMKEKYGWTRQTVQNYRKGTTVPDDTKALDIAAELELNTLYVIACVNLDRVGEAESRKAWKAVAEQTKNLAAAVILSALGGVIALAGILAPSTAYAQSEVSAETDTIYIMRMLRRWLARWLDQAADELADAALA